MRAEVLPDPTNNPLDRLRLHVNPDEARITATDLAGALAAGDPPVIVRDHHAEHGFFELDPCNLHDGEAEIVADRITGELERARLHGSPGRSLSELKAEAMRRLLAWPD